MGINWKALMLEKLRGGGGFSLFVPRMDIWYNHNSQMGTLPESCRSKSLREIAGDLGIGFHAVIPDYVHGPGLEDIIHRGLGYYNHPDFPFVFDFGDVDFETEVSGEEVKVLYHSALGEVSLRFEYGPEFLKEGHSIPPMLEHPIKGERDYDRLKDILSRVKIRERISGYDRFYHRIGDDGFAVCCTTLAAGPVAHIHRDLRRMDDFFLDQYDFPQKIGALAEVIAPHYDKMIDIAARTKAEVVVMGANYDEMITIEPLFREHFMPWLVKAGQRLHGEGKFLLTHTDGENRGLMGCYLESNFDIADSVAPAPMTKLTLKDYRDAFQGKITIWGGIPSSIMIKEACSWEDFKTWFEGAMKDAAPFDHLILSIADTCPPQADFGRVEFLCDRLNREV